MKHEIIQNAKLAYPAMFVLFVVLAFFDFRSVILTGDWLDWDTLTGSVLAICAIMLLRQGIPVLRFRAPEQNFISWDGEGLSYAAWGEFWTWPWRDLRPLRVTRAFPTFHKVIRLPPPDEGNAGAKASARKAAMIITNAYELSPEEIVARLNECRERALSRNGPNRHGEA